MEHKIFLNKFESYVILNFIDTENAGLCITTYRDLVLTDLIQVFQSTDH